MIALRSLGRVVPLSLAGVLFATVGVSQTPNMERAYQAMEIARSLKARGDLDDAERMFRLVIESAQKGSNVAAEAQDELGYYIPLLRIQKLVWDGQLQRAERELLALQQTVEDRPLRRQEINRIMSGLRSGSAAPGDEEAGKIDEKQVTQVARSALDTWFRTHGDYPASRSALRSALPLDAVPLSAYEVSRYSTDGAGYLLVLRRKSDPAQTITLQHTGLLQPSAGP